MTIDGVDISVFGAALVGLSAGLPDITNTYFYDGSMKSPRLIRLGGNVGLRKISLNFEVNGVSEHNTALNVSNLLNALRRGSEMEIGDGYSYYYAIDSVGDSPERISPTITTLSVVCVGYRHGSTVTQTLSSSGTVTATGNYATPARFTIQKTSGTTFQVNDMIYTGEAGAETIVIDGFAKKVTKNGANIFSRMQMASFPLLSPGANTITIVGTGTLTVEYQPIFL